MNDHPLISVIIAIYNVEKYLRKCLDSVINQSYKNLEIILVNDGSPDSSIRICEEYAAKDNRVVVLSKENGGQSTARNFALDRCRGEYVGFIDGDDWIEPNMYERMLKAIQQNEADIVQCGCLIHNNGVQHKDVDSRCFKSYTGVEAVKDLLKPSFAEINTSVCNKLFSRAIIGDIRFTPVRAFEDDEFNVRTLAISRNVVCIAEWLYDYNQHEGSTMTNSFNINKIALVTIQRNITDYIEQTIPELYLYCQKSLFSKELFTLANLLKYKQIDKDGSHAHKLYCDIMSDYNLFMHNELIGVKRLLLVLIKYMPSCVWQKILKLSI